MSLLRDFDEVGRFEGWSDRVNEAYRTYVSLWLNDYDDNIDKFKIRMHDVQPVRERNLPEYSVESEPLYYEAYMDAAMLFVESYYAHGGMARKPGYWMKNYPILRERADAIDICYNLNLSLKKTGMDIPAAVDVADEAKSDHDNECELD